MKKQNKVVEKANVEKSISRKKLFIEKRVAYIEGVYKGLWLVIPEDLRYVNGKKLAPAKIRFAADEKSLMRVKEVLEFEIAQYDCAFQKSMDKDVAFRKYGNILSALEGLKGEIDYVLREMNENMVDDGYGL